MFNTTFILFRFLINYGYVIFLYIFIKLISEKRKCRNFSPLCGSSASLCRQIMEDNKNPPVRRSCLWSKLVVLKMPSLSGIHIIPNGKICSFTKWSCWRICQFLVTHFLLICQALFKSTVNIRLLLRHKTEISIFLCNAKINTDATLIKKPITSVNFLSYLNKSV